MYKKYVLLSIHEHYLFPHPPLAKNLRKNLFGKNPNFLHFVTVGISHLPNAFVDLNCQLYPFQTNPDWQDYADNLMIKDTRIHM